METAFIHHGPEIQPTKGAKGGGGIILSKEWAKGWVKGGSIILYRGMSVGTTRLLSVDVAIETDNSKSKTKATKYKNSE